MNFTELRRANRIVIVTNRFDKVLRTIDDSQEVAKVVTFVEREAEGWDVPWYGAPVPKINITFYAGHRLVNTVGIGPNFLGTQFKGNFYSKEIDSATRAAVLDLVGLHGR
jgi:hypothetical protein